MAGSVLVPAARAEALAKPIRPMPAFSFDNLLERPSEKIVGTYFGDKDGGKTREMLGMGAREGARHLCLSFDQKSKGVKVGAFANDRRIWVVDAVQFYADSQPEEITWSAEVTVNFLNYVLEQLAPRFHPHFVDFDGTEVLENIAEMKMRHQHGLAMSEGFAERAWWKDRRAVLRSLHRKAASIAGVGVNYTAYYDRQPADEGATKIRDKVPRWIDVMLQETDIAIDCRSSYSTTTKTKSYERYVFAAKAHLCDPALPGFLLRLGQVTDVTGRSLEWGPGLASRIAGFDARMKDVEILYPAESSVFAEARNFLAPVPVVEAGSPPAVPSSAAPTPPALPVKPSSPPAERTAGDEF